MSGDIAPGEAVNEMIRAIARIIKVRQLVD
jgi:hypothetical protein